MVTDVAILVLPLPVIWQLQMSMKRRLGVLVVITTGGSAVLVGALRAIILAEFGSSPDFTWSLGKMVIISNVEMQVAILAANMPALKAFYECWRKGTLLPGSRPTGASSYAVNNSGGDGSGAGLSGRRGDMEMNSGLRSGAKRSASTDPMALTMTESEEKLFETQHQKHGLAAASVYQSSERSA